MIATAISIDSMPTFEDHRIDINGNSQAAIEFNEIIENAEAHFNKSLTLSRNQSLSDELLTTYKKCRKENWDGEDADSVKIETIYYAIMFIKQLPKYLPTPEISADNDGEISFEWYKDKNHMLFLSISPEGRISYAGRYGTKSKANGEEWIYDEIPEEILQKIIKLKS